MKKIPCFQVDAFASQPFTGNPAGVCLLDSWPDDTVLRSVAFENNLSETAFLVPKKDQFELRWFTTVVEVDLCGHATLASAHVICTDLRLAGEELSSCGDRREGRNLCERHHRTVIERGGSIWG